MKALVSTNTGVCYLLGADFILESHPAVNATTPEFQVIEVETIGQSNVIQDGVVVVCTTVSEKDGDTFYCPLKVYREDGKPYDPNVVGGAILGLYHRSKKA